MALSDTIKRFEMKQKLKVVDLLQEMELLKAQFFADDDVPFIVRGKAENKYLESQMVAHYNEVSKALKRYLMIEDILSGIYAEYTIEVQGYRFSVATGIKLMKEMQVIDHDRVTGHLILSQHPMAIFLNKCYAGSMNYLSEETKILDPNGLLGDTAIEDIIYRVDAFLIELKYAIEKFNLETEVTT